MNARMVWHSNEASAVHMWKTQPNECNSNVENEHKKYERKRSKRCHIKISVNCWDATRRWPFIWHFHCVMLVKQSTLCITLLLTRSGLRPGSSFICAVLFCLFICIAKCVSLASSCEFMTYRCHRTTNRLKYIESIDNQRNWRVERARLA